MNAIILARVSTKEQEEGHSIDAQIARLQEYCHRKTLKVLKVFTVVESSTQGERKEFHKLIEFAKAQKETVAIVCDAVDRLQRGFRETPMLDALLKAGKIELHFNRESICIHQASNGSQILMWNMGVLMANSYVLNLSDNVKRSINHKIKNGQWIGKAPIGYKSVIDPETGRKKPVPDAETAFLVKRIFEEYGQGGKSLREIVALAKKWGLVSEGGKPYRTGNIYKLLQNPFYFGMMKVKGQVYPATHTPIISKELYDRCQAIRLGWKKKPFKYSDKPFIFRGLIKCAYCGCTITSDLKKGKYVYMYCTKSRGACEGVRVREEEILEQVKDVFRSFQIPTPVLESIKEHLAESAQAKKAFHQESIGRVRKNYDLTQRKLDALLDMRLEGSITRDEYDKKCTELKERQYELNHELSAHTEADEKFNMTFGALLDLASRSYELFECSKVEQKRQLINFTLSNLALKGVTLQYEIKKPFSDLQKTAECSQMRARRDSNSRPSGSKPDALSN